MVEALIYAGAWGGMVWALWRWSLKSETGSDK